MKKKELQDLRKKDAKELYKMLAERKEKLLKLVMEIKAGKEKNLKKAKNLKNEIAQVETLARESELMSSKSTKQ